VAGRLFSPGTPVSSINKTDRHDIPVAEILLKVALKIRTLTPNSDIQAIVYTTIPIKIGKSFIENHNLIKIRYLLDLFY
jgi:hypothetical protein